MIMAIRYVHENKLVLSHLDTSSIGIVEDDCRKMDTGIAYKVLIYLYRLYNLIMPIYLKIIKT